MELNQYSLRERKHARTKIAVINAFIDALEKSRYEDISIRSICKAVDISEGTFFNYFSEKLDILDYYAQLLFLKINWDARQEANEEDFPYFLDVLFRKLAEEHKNPNIIYKMMSVLLVQQQRPKRVEIPEVELKTFFPDCPGIEDIPQVRPGEFFSECLEKARKNNKIPAGVKLEDLNISLNTILIGTMLALKFGEQSSKGYHYERQLKLLWKALAIKYTSRKK